MIRKITILSIEYRTVSSRSESSNLKRTLIERYKNARFPETKLRLITIFSGLSCHPVYHLGLSTNLLNTMTEKTNVVLVGASGETGKSIADGILAFPDKFV